MDDQEVVIRVESATRVNVEWPYRLNDTLHAAARELIQGVHGVDAVQSTRYREVVQIASHVTSAEMAAQDIANALLDDSGAFQRNWRNCGYDEIAVAVRRW